MKKNAILIGVSLLIVLFFVGSTANFYKLTFVEKLSAFIYDQRLQLTMPNTQDQRVVILDIDEKSLKEQGRWPWSRDKLALLMNKLFDQYHIAVLGFDVVFAEKDESSGLKVLQQLQQNQLKNTPAYAEALNRIRPQLEYDHLFANSIKKRNIVLGYYLTQPGSSTTGALPPPVFPTGHFRNTSIGFTSWSGYGANLAEIQQSAASSGHFNPLIDVDGVVRRVPMIIEYKGAYYESLSLAMVRTLLGHAKVVPGFAEGDHQGYSGLEWIELDAAGIKLRIPVDGQVSSFVPYRGKAGSFPYISITDVLNDRIKPEQLKDKIVLMGTTAPGLLDLRATPVSEVYPGVEVHANLIAGILDQNLKQRPAYMMGAEVIWLLCIGALLSYWLPRLPALKAIIVSGLALIFSMIISISAWAYAGLIMNIAATLIVIVLLFALNVSYGYFFESRTKRQITSLFGQYVPGELVEEMAKHPDSISMAGDSREMTILFSDVRSFTTISEGMDPKELALLMNEFLTPLSRVIHRHRGTIDKYMGDCIMAFWGAPLPDEQHARHALEAGLEMLATLEKLQPEFKKRGWPEIHIGVGINTGRVNVGNMGSEIRVAYTVMGDEVNLASRLEGITKQYGVGIVVGENTRNTVKDFVYRELDLVRVKGKDKPVAIYEPIGLNGQVDKAKLDELKLFHEVRALYRKQNWDQAELQLLNLQRISPETELYRIYTERIAYFRQNPPAENWDGVFVFQVK